MPISSLDKTTALVVIDLQKGILSMPRVHSIADVLANSARLAQAFRARGLPVALVNVAGVAPGRTQAKMNFTPPPDWTDLAPELGSAPDDILVTKHTWGAFHGTALDMMLRRRGVTQVALAGVATSIGVESTARAAYEHGYHVALVTDAMTDMSLEAHQNSLERIFPRLGEMGATAEMLALLS